MEFKWLNSQVTEETIEPVLVFNEKGEILFGNRTASEKLDYSRKELAKCSMQQIFRMDFPEEKDIVPDFDRKVLEEKAETAMYRKNSSCFPVKTRIFPTEEPGVYLLLAEDITNQKDVNIRIRKLKEDEEKNQRARNEFTANVTHELRTPVNGIKGHVLTLLDAVEDEGQRKTLELILYCCDNMYAIINNILDFAKLETGKFTIEEKEFDFYKMMERVVATHSAEINKKELHFSVGIDEQIPRFLIGDELRLVQILNNLLSNAIKFTLVGHVNVDVSKTMQINDEIELFFMVKDSGIGISKKEQDRLFQSFSQADASITRRFGGTGLGLAITRQLVELMHGDIRVESEKGKGSTFSFSIRLKTGQNMDDTNEEVYESWADFIREENLEDFSEEEEVDSRKEMKKRLDKLAMSIEMGAWEKAEALADTIKALAGKDDENMKKLVLRMEMAIRKCNYEKSIDACNNVKKAFEASIGDL